MWRIFLAATVLGIVGIVGVMSVAPDMARTQAGFLIFGFFLFFIFSRIDYRIWPSLGGVMYLTSLALLLIVFVFGEAIRGSVRWINIGPWSFQPSEIIKPLLILFFAERLSRPKLLFADLIKNFFLFLLPVVLIAKQPDLGNALILSAIFGTMMLPRLRWRELGLLGILGILGTRVGWFFLHDYQRERILTFLNPGHDPLGSGYNALQAQIAVGAGQLMGRGLGWGTQSHLAFLPEKHTDFIFASLSEELGLLGVLGILGAYFFLLWQILKAAGVKDLFGKTVAGGILAMIFFQVVVNAGMNMGIMPITGITLPLISYGGNSIMATMISLGIVANIIQQEKSKSGLEIK